MNCKTIISFRMFPVPCSSSQWTFFLHYLHQKEVVDHLNLFALSILGRFLASYDSHLMFWFWFFESFGKTACSFGLPTAWLPTHYNQCHLERKICFRVWWWWSLIKDTTCNYILMQDNIMDTRRSIEFQIYQFINKLAQ